MEIYNKLPVELKSIIGRYVVSDNRVVYKVLSHIINKYLKFSFSYNTQVNYSNLLLIIKQCILNNQYKDNKIYTQQYVKFFISNSVKLSNYKNIISLGRNEYLSIHDNNIYMSNSKNLTMISYPLCYNYLINTNWEFSNDYNIILYDNLSHYSYKTVFRINNLYEFIKLFCNYVPNYSTIYFEEDCCMITFCSHTSTIDIE